MKQFIFKIFLFVGIPVSIYIISIAVLPMNFYSFRQWEALSYYKLNSFGAFYPSQKILMTEEGDLGHRTKFAIKKRTLWVTDAIGFRNNTFINDPDILLIGDSFVAGASLDQDATLTNQLSRLLSGNGKPIKVYNMATSDFNVFKMMLKYGLLKKPKLIIFAPCERTVPNLQQIAPISPELYKERLLTVTYPKTCIFIDKFFKFECYHWISSRLNPARTTWQDSRIKIGMLFTQGKQSEIIPFSPDFQKSVHSLTTYKAVCDSLGIDFLFMPLPNKETVYYDLVPFKKQPGFCSALDSTLNTAGIHTINLVEKFTTAKEKGAAVYNDDDMHWAYPGVKIAADEIMQNNFVQSTLKK